MKFRSTALRFVAICLFISVTYSLLPEPEDDETYFQDLDQTSRPLNKNHGKNLWDHYWEQVAAKTEESGIFHNELFSGQQTHGSSIPAIIAAIISIVFISLGIGMLTVVALMDSFEDHLDGQSYFIIAIFLLDIVFVGMCIFQCFRNRKIHRSMTKQADDYRANHRISKGQWEEKLKHTKTYQT